MGVFEFHLYGEKMSVTIDIGSLELIACPVDERDLPVEVVLSPDQERWMSPGDRVSMLDVSGLRGNAGVVLLAQGFQYAVLIHDVKGQAEGIVDVLVSHTHHRADEARAIASAQQPCFFVIDDESILERIVVKLRKIVGSENVSAGILTRNGVAIAREWPPLSELSS